MEDIRREGDQMVEVRRWSAIVSYEEILAKTMVVDDDDHGPPWKECDGYEHDAVSMRTVEDSSYWGHWADEGSKVKWVPHYNEGDIAHVGHHDRRLVLVSKEQAARWGIARCAHANGASRQVAAEAEAAERRRTIDQLVEWYADGWRWYGVVCKHRLCKVHGVAESLWGVDDEDYADEEVRPEIAGQVCDELEKLGYTITGRPPEGKTREQKQAHLRSRIAYQLGFRKPEEYLAWLAKKGWKGRPRGPRSESSTAAASS